MRDYAGLSVSRETADRLDGFESELKRWQSIANLVGSSELADLKHRHIADSLQIAFLGGKGDWVDLGSGAGFPGLVVAIARPELPVRLVEANSRKCAFLRHCARVYAPNVEVHDGRIEEVVPRLPKASTVSARALAPLPKLIGWAAPLLLGGAIGVFPKGQTHLAELTEARESWRFEAELVPSRTDPQARIICIHRFAGGHDD